MPPFANELHSFSGVVNEQPVPESDLEQVNTVELSGSPEVTNFFNRNERKEDLANPLQMVELLHTAQRLHDMEPQAVQRFPDLESKAIQKLHDLARIPVKVENAHDFSLLFDSKSLDTNRKISARAGEDKKQLGMLLSRPVSPSDHNSAQGFVRKRSLSSMLESEDLDQPETLRSYTSSESDPGAGEETHFSSGAVAQYPRKFPKRERLASAEMDKDLLSLSLPVSSFNSESSSSSRELDRQLQNKPDGGIPFRACKVYPTAENDVAESDMLNATTISAMSRQFRSKQEEHVMQQRIGSADDAAGDTSTHSSTEPTSPMVREEDEAGVQLTLQLDSRKPREFRRAKFLPLTGLEAAEMNKHNLLMRDLDTGLEAHGLQLVHLLLKCADATDKQNVDLAARILGELYQGASLYGDSMQRVAAYFAEGLAARIVSKESPVYSTLMIQPSIEDYFAAFTTLYKVAPYFQFAHFTANQAIIEAVEGHSNVHVIDLDIMQGFQWPSLIQALASREGGPPHLRITGVGRHSNIVEETGRRLTSFAASFDVPFEFHSLVEPNLENFNPDAVALRLGEAVAVNSVLQLHRLLNPSSGENLHKFMHSLCRKINPCVVTVVEQEANHNASSFLGRFMEALQYYAAVFDSLDASLPQQNEERVKVEQFFFAQQIKNIVVCDGDDRVERHENIELWQQRMEMAGFIQVPLSGYAISQAKLLLQFCPCEGYRLHERNDGSISLGWQERQLLTASAWTC